MEKTKDLFMMMREKEVATTKFLPSKKELTCSSKEFANMLLNNGDINLEEVYSQALRLKESLSTIEGVLKERLPQENFEAFGLKGTFRSGGDSLNYSDDPIYSELKKHLDDRAELLKTAYKTKQEFYDSDGICVPVVSSTPRKSSLAISF